MGKSTRYLAGKSIYYLNDISKHAPFTITQLHYTCNASFYSCFFFSKLAICVVAEAISAFYFSLNVFFVVQSVCFHSLKWISKIYSVIYIDITCSCESGKFYIFSHLFGYFKYRPCTEHLDGSIKIISAHFVLQSE